MTYITFFAICFVVIWGMLIINFLYFLPLSRQLNTETNTDYKKASKLLLEKKMNPLVYIFDTIEIKSSDTEAIISLKQKIKPYVVRHFILLILMLLDFILAFAALRLRS